MFSSQTLSTFTNLQFVNQMCVWVDWTANMHCTICIQLVYNSPWTKICQFLARTQTELCALCRQVFHVHKPQVRRLHFLHFLIWTHQCLLHVCWNYSLSRVHCTLTENWFTIYLVGTVLYMTHTARSRLLISPSCFSSTFTSGLGPHSTSITFVKNFHVITNEWSWLLISYMSK